jgi:hypothetical protein
MLIRDRRFYGGIGYEYPLALSGPDILAYRSQAVEIVYGGYGAVRHLGGCTYVKFDGSAKWLRIERLRLPSLGRGCNFRHEVTSWMGPADGPHFAVRTD